VSTDSIQYNNVVDNEVFSGSSTATLQLLSVPTSMHGYRFRCVIDGVAKDFYSLRFVNTWKGDNGNAWETPANWSCGIVPDENMEVVIPANA
jgi:hypothetical protein